MVWPKSPYHLKPPSYSGPVLPPQQSPWGEKMCVFQPGENEVILPLRAQKGILISWIATLPETNIFAPENGWLEY